MSGGQLVLLDSHRREVKRFPLSEGLATLGRDPTNDIRITLSSVAPHHATVVVRDDKTVVRSVGGVTLVNGRAVSVAALRHGDVISIAERALRWEYTQPTNTSMPSPAGALSSPSAARRGRGVRAAPARRSVPAPAAPRDRALQLAIEMSHRASMPASSGGKQVAIVQPQRRNASDQTDKSSPRSSPQTTAPGRRSTSQELSPALREEDKSKRKSRTSPKNFLHNTTKATLWIESRKTSPRRKTQLPSASPAPAPAPPRRSLPHKKSTPLRMTVLKRAQSAHKARVIKIEAPLKIDHTKQAAIMLMTGHTPKVKLSISPKDRSSGKKSPSYVVKKPSPVRKTPRGKGRQAGRRSKDTGQSIGVTPSRGSTYAQESANRRSSKRNTTNPSVSIFEISDSTRNSTIRASNVSTRSGKTPQKSPSLPSPKKSAMKDHSKKNVRKTESIKFDLSNLQGHQEASEVLSLTDTTQNSDEDITLHYSESSTQSQSPSPRRSIHSRSSRMLERLGTTLTTTPGSPSRTLTLTSRVLTPDSPSSRRSIRGSAMVQKALETSSDRTKTILSPNSSALSDRTRTILSNTSISDRTKTIPSTDTTTASAFRTRTLSPRSNHNLESYSVVDLVSFNTGDGSKSVYNSAGSENSSEFGTPPTTGRRTRSTIGPNLGTSTPYAGRARSTRSKSSSNVTNERTSTVSTRRSKSLSTPENKHISVNSTRVSRASRSRSRINDSDLMLLDDTEAEDSSPKTSKRSRATKSVTKENIDANLTSNSTENGMSTPENRHSPEAIGTPMLSIQSLLDSSRSSIASQNSRRGKFNPKRKTIGVLSEPKRRADAKSKSIGPIVSSVRKTRLRLSHDSDRTDEGAPQPDNDETITPRSAVKPSPEAVKNKHSTAKKPQSKRSIIDDLNRSDIVKQLFNSPVKRKLSQSMTEFSRRQLFEDEDDAVKVKRPTRRTIAVASRTPDSSLLEPTSITPERFVSPVETPNNSPNLSGLKRLFGNSPGSSRRGGGDSPRATRIRNSPRNDLRRVTGVRTIFQQTSPRNDLTDVRGVRRMFQKKSPENDLRNVSGVKRTIARTSPRNDLTDVRGVRRLFKQRKPASYHDVSGVEELFDTSARSADRSEILFDMLVGRPPVKAVYSKTFTTTAARRPRTRRRSLRASVEVTPQNVDEWLEQELKKRLPAPTSSVTKELQRLATDTVEGSLPIRGSRTRNSSFKAYKSASDVYNASTLPIKKRSLVEASMERSRRQLPLKKRAIHSTPVKGRVEVTMNASELGRVSPIAAVHVTRDIEQEGFVSRSTQTVNEELDTLTTTKTRTPRKQETPKKIEIAQATPEKSPEKPVSKRATRNRKVTEISQSNTKKRQSSLVVAKKAPVMSPKAKSPEDTQNQSPKVESGQTRAHKVSVVVAKASPKMKPQPAANTANKSKNRVVTPKTTRTRKVTIKDPESPKQSPLKKRSARVKASDNEPKASTSKVEVEKSAPAKRGRKTLAEVSPQPKRTRNTKASESSVAETKQTSLITTRRGRAATKPEPEKKLPTGRGKKAQSQASSESEPEEKRPNNRGKKATRVEPAIVEKKPTRGRKNQTSVESEPEEKRTSNRGRKVQNQTKDEPEPETKRLNKRGKNTETNAQTVTREKQPKSRGKKTQNQSIVQSEPEEKRSNTRGRKGQNQTVEAFVEVKQPNKSGKKVQFQESTQFESSIQRGLKGKTTKNEPKTRSNKVQSPPGSPPEPRSRRAKVDDNVITETRGRKRKAPPTEDIPSKIAKSGPKKTPEASTKKSTAKQNRNVSKDNKVESGKQAKTTREAKAKPVEKNAATEAKPTRGRKVEDSKEEMTTGRSKRKANVEPSPTKVAKKAVKESKKASPAAARALRAKGKRSEVTTTVARTRRR